MINYSDLSESQQEAVVDAVELKAGYDSLELEPVDDPRQAVEYKNFRRELEGTEVDSGEMSEEQLEGYLKAGILQEDEDGLEINSVWLPGHLETLEENGMIDIEFDDLYVARDEERGIEKAVYGDESEFLSNARHGGGLRFSFEGDVGEENDLGRNEEKIEEMIGDFVYSIRGGEIEKDRDEYVENFSLENFLENDTIVPKPEKTRRPNGGEEFMTEDGFPGEDYDSPEEVYEGLMSGDLGESAARRVLEEYESVKDPTMADVLMTTAAYQAMGQDMNEAIDSALETYIEDVERLQEVKSAVLFDLEITKDNAQSQIDRMEETELRLEDSYIQDVSDFGEAFRQHANHSREMKDKLEETNEELRNATRDLEDAEPGTFSSEVDERIREDLDELERVREEHLGSD